MWCFLVFYCVVTIFGIVYSLPELCVFEDNLQEAHCGKSDVEYIFDFIPPISQYITYIDLENQPLKKLPNNGFRNLSSQSNISTIKLRYCQISHVNAGAFLNLHNLTIIDLSHNDIHQIDKNLFGDTKQIKVIDMAYNKIKVLPNGIFQNLILLEKVNLHHNQINHVEKFSFQNTPSLRIIHLNNNQIQFINMLFKDKFVNLTIIWLAGNPWKCNCKLKPFYEFLKKNNQLNQQGLVCEKPPELYGRKWNDLSGNEFRCSSGVTISARDSVITNTEPVITAELGISKSTFVKLDTNEENIETETITTYENPKIVTDESYEKPVTKRTPVIIDEKQVPEVEDDTNSSEIRNSEFVTTESNTETEEINTEMEEPTITEELVIEELTTITEPIKTSQVDVHIVSTTELSFTNYEGADRNLEQFLKDLEWMAWTLCSVAMICLLIVAIGFICAVKFTFISFKRRKLSSTDEHIEEPSGLLYFQQAQQENC